MQSKVIQIPARPQLDLIQICTRFHRYQICLDLKLIAIQTGLALCMTQPWRDFRQIQLNPTFARYNPNPQIVSKL